MNALRKRGKPCSKETLQKYYLDKQKINLLIKFRNLIIVSQKIFHENVDSRGEKSSISWRHPMIFFQLKRNKIF